MQDLGAPLRVHALHLGVPALDAVVQIDGEDADVDRLNDIFVELFQALELRDLLFEALVELRILDSDADVTGERFEQLHVFARQEVAIVGAAQADDGNSPGASSIAIGDAAGKVVVQVKPSGTAALRFGETKNVLWILKKDVIVCARTVEVEKADVERAQIGS